MFVYESYIFTRKTRLNCKFHLKNVVIYRGIIYFITPTTSQVYIMNIQIIFIMDNDAREISIFSAALTDDVVVVVEVVVAATPPAVVVEVDEDEP